MNLFYLLISVLGFSLVIAIHEFGHFFACKFFSIPVETFSIGFGPVIFQKKISETNFCISIIPLGGYNGIKSINDENEENKDSCFENRSFFVKLTVMIGGIIFNLIFTYVLFVVLGAIGSPEATIKSVLINNVTPNSVAQKAGITQGDLLIGFNGTPFTKAETNYDKFREALIDQSKSSINLLMKRDSDIKEIVVILEQKRIPSALTLGIEGTPNVVTRIKEKLSLIPSLEFGFSLMKKEIYGIIINIKSAFKEKSLKGFVGPLKMIGISKNQAMQGVRHFLIFWANVSLSLAVLNFLPLGILDGGKIFIITLEACIRRRLSESVETGFMLLSLFTLGVFFLITFSQDIQWIISSLF